MANRNQKKVVFFINVDWYFNLHWVNRARKALENGYQVHVVTNFISKKIKTQLMHEGFYCRHISFDRKSLNPFSIIKTTLHFFFIILSIKPDILHCITVKANLIGGTVARLFNIPVIFSVTGLGTSFSSNRISSLFARNLVVKAFKWVARGARYRIIFENNDDKATFNKLKIGHPDCLLVIKGAGVDINLFSFSSKFPVNPVVFFAARLLWDKGLDNLIEASKILRSRGRNFTIKVAGIIDKQNINAIDEKQIIKWHEHGLIEWLGQRNDMASLLSHSSMVVLPTTYGEGIPRILIEAASTGRPIIGTDVSGCREIIRHGYNGFLVPPSDPEKLADAIDELLLDSRKQIQFGSNGRLMVEQEFTEKKVIAETFAVYNQLMLTHQ
jgi:glycosyltransferase involved in cell wall biosynthesis